MSLYSDASLAMIPSAYKDGKLYSIRPTDGSGDFTFTRGSNLAATRVDVNGLIEKGIENLLLQSNQFDTTWVLSGATITSGQADKDGSNDAWALTSTTTNGAHRVVQTFTGAANNVVTFSVFAKANGYNFLRIIENATTGDFATFDLSDGSVENNTGISNTATIEAVSGADGWYRCSVAVDCGATTRFDIYTMETSGTTSFLGDGVSGAYIMNAQAEQGLVATDYIETTTTTAQAGILEDMPRLDYSGGASCPSLLLEPQRSNLITHSEYRDGSVVTNGFISQATINSPEGIKNAYKLFDNSAGGANQVNQGIVVSLPSSGTYTYSVFVKADQLNWVRLRTLGFDAGGNNESWFDLLNGTKGTINHDNATIEDYGSGWYRCSVTFTSTSDLSGVVYIYLADNDNDASVLLDGTSSIFMYGFQLEVGSYPTSYIPTYGTSQTRSDESAQYATSNLISTQSFTLFFEHKALGSTPVSSLIYSLSVDGGDDISLWSNSADGLNVYLYANGGYIFGSNYNDGLTIGSNSKVALTYDGDRLAYFINGSLYNSTTNVSFYNAENYIFMRAGVSSIEQKQALVFPTALTDSECIALTTL